MTQITVTTKIRAPIEFVFGTVTDVENLPATNPDVVRIEFHSDIRSGVGTRFRETRVMNGKEATTDLEITEFVENEHARMVADSHGTIWDTVFKVRPAGDQTELEIRMDARPHELLPKLLNPLMSGFFRRGMQKHVAALREYCERSAT